MKKLDCKFTPATAQHFPISSKLQSLEVGRDIAGRVVFGCAVERFGIGRVGGRFFLVLHTVILRIIVTSEKQRTERDRRKGREATMCQYMKLS